LFWRFFSKKIFSFIVLFDNNIYKLQFIKEKIVSNSFHKYAYIQAFLRNGFGELKKRKGLQKLQPKEIIKKYQKE
jgi:hypothetical protein